MKKILLSFAILCSCISFAQETGKQEYSTHESVINELYKLCSFEADKLPDWDKMKDLFTEKAYIALRSGPGKFEVIDREGFIKLWLRDIANYKLDKTGFTEKMMKKKVLALGDIATYIIQYEASVPGMKMPPQPGIDMISLVKLNGRWYITSIVNEVPTPKNPVPQDFFE